MSINNYKKNNEIDIKIINNFGLEGKTLPLPPKKIKIVSRIKENSNEKNTLLESSGKGTK